MRTKIRCVHEESYSDKSKVLGIILNYSIDADKLNWKESFAYIYHNEIYIIFNTMFEMMDYLLYGEKKMKRAYMEESEFDSILDAEFIDETFEKKLKWQ